MCVFYTTRNTIVLKEGKVCNMKKRILIGIYIVLLLICGKLAFNFGYNEIVVAAYHQYNYSVTMKPLLIFNWSEPYIAHYNQGNIYYQNFSYEDAILSYREALGANPPEEKECDIRINLALAMLGTMEEEYEAPENVETSLEILLGAKEVLLEEDCATENGDGHNETAEQLKEEIEAMIAKLKEQSEMEQEEKGDEDEGKDEEQRTKEDEFEEDVKKTLQERQSEANQERSEALEYYEELEKDYNFDSDGYIW